MTTIRITTAVKDIDNVIVLELVRLDNETFFHVHGLKACRRIDHRVHCDWPRSLAHAQELYDHYAEMFK